MGTAHTLRDANAARVLLRMMDARRRDRREDAAERMQAMLGALDVIVARFPADPPDELVHEFERVVNALRTADDLLSTDPTSFPGRQSLDLAWARLTRLAMLLDPASPRN